MTELGVDDEDCLSTTEVKIGLKQNTRDAIDKGIFGVPSFMVDGEIFWGFDSVDFLLAYLNEPELLRSPGMQAADAMPEGITR